ncbi:hypothetical protein Tco_1441371, partial [Tanacetum coccineum]
AVEDLMIVAEQGFKDYKYSDISIHQRVKVLSRLQRSAEMKAKQEKDMFEYSTDLNSSQDEDTSCAWKKIENLKLSKLTSS